MPRLIIRRDARVERKVEFDAPSLRIGRDAQNDIVLDASDGTVSRFHAEIRGDDAGYSIVDLHSTNGTWVNGQQITTTPLVPGTIVEVGPFTLEFQSGAAAKAVPGTPRSSDTVVDPVVAAPPVAAARGPRIQHPRHRRPAWQPRALLFGGTTILVAGILGVASYRGATRVTTTEPPDAASRETQNEVAQHLGAAQRLMDAGDAAAVRRELDAVFAIDPTNRRATALREALDKLEATRVPSERRRPTTRLPLEDRQPEALFARPLRDGRDAPSVLAGFRPCEGLGPL